MPHYVKGSWITSVCALFFMRRQVPRVCSQLFQSPGTSHQGASGGPHFPAGTPERHHILTPPRGQALTLKFVGVPSDGFQRLGCAVLGVIGGYASYHFCLESLGETLQTHICQNTPNLHPLIHNLGFRGLKVLFQDSWGPEFQQQPLVKPSGYPIISIFWLVEGSQVRLSYTVLA